MASKQSTPEYVLVSQYLEDLIEELGKEEADKMPNKTIARAIYAQNRALFDKHDNNDKNIEYIRGIVRYFRGNSGHVHREGTSSHEHLHRENRTPLQALREYDFRPIEIKNDDLIFPHKKPLILSDIHIPFHNEEKIEAAVNYGIKYGCDSIYLNGDTLDAGKVSSFVPDIYAVDFVEERDLFWVFIEWLKTTGLPIYFKEGNHEFRIEYQQRKRNPQMAKFEDLSLKNLLHLDKLGVEHVAHQQKTQMGDLLVVHGHEFGNSVFSPVNPARGLFLRAKCSVLAGHYHQSSEHQESNLKGEDILCFSTGCLSTLNPGYRPMAYTKWNHGFAVVEIEEDGGFDVWNKRFINDKIR